MQSGKDYKRRSLSMGLCQNCPIFRRYMPDGGVLQVPLGGNGPPGASLSRGVWPSIRRETRSFYGEEIQDLSNLFQFLRTGRRGTIYERLRKALPDSPALALGRIRSSPRRRSTMSVISISVLSANPLMHLVTL